MGNPLSEKELNLIRCLLAGGELSFGRADLPL